MELKKISEVLDKTQMNFIDKKAYNYAASLATNSYILELLYSKYYYKFLQEALNGMCLNW